METVASELQSIEKRVGAFLDPTHIVLLLCLAGALLAGVYLFESKAADRAEARAEQATALAAQAKDEAVASAKQNADFQARKDAEILALQQANSQLTAANKELAKAMQAEMDALAAQQAADRKMSPTQQAIRWHQLVPQAEVETAPNGFLVDSAGGLATVIELEKVPVLTKQLAQADQALDNDRVVIANDEDILKKEKDAHASDVANDKKQLIASQDETKKVQSDFDSYKKKSRKNIIKVYVAGVVTGVAIKRLLGF